MEDLEFKYKKRKNVIDTITNIINSYPTNNPEDTVVIYDIDDTLIDSNTEEPIQDVLNTYNSALSKGFTLVLITARPKTVSSINQTILDLQKCQIKNFKAIYFFERNNCNSDIYKCVEKYKENARLDVNTRGYKVLMSIGDMYWDIGKHGGLGFLV
jgi:hypothetical protein